MKKNLFWITFIPLGFVVLIANLMVFVGEALDECLAKYEGWCMGYTEDGYKYIGGIWYKRH